MRNFFVCILILVMLVACSTESEQLAVSSSTSTTQATIKPTATPTNQPIATPTTQPTATPTTQPTSTPANQATISPSPISNLKSPTPIYTYEIINTFPHDPNAFTQGLVYADDIFYESTGLWGQSTVRRVEPSSGEVLQSVSIADDQFGEGITIFAGIIYQITWQSHIAYLYDKDTLELTGEFSYQTEGWGITHDGERLIMSDGTPIITFRDPETFAPSGQIEVHDESGLRAQLNELEYIDGEIWANVWLTDEILRISPETGKVLGVIDLAGIFPHDDPDDPDDVLNGIAYDPGTGRIFVTGKLWPEIFEIEVMVE